MSNVSSVSSIANPYQTTNQNGFGQFLQDFKALGGALQSGNLSTAQSALATFQQDLQSNAPAASSQTSANQPFGKNTQANTDFQNLASALQSGDLSSAQKAFASLQTDLQATQKGHHHHHHGSGSTTQTAPTASGTTANSATDSDGDNDGSNLNAIA
jgi:hypothetical protein